MIIGSIEFLSRQGSDFNPQKHLRSYLRYALKTDDTITNMVVRRGAGDFEVNDRIISRCEVVLAWRLLPRKLQDAIKDRVILQRPPYEVALAYGVSIRTVQRYVEEGLRRMVNRVYEVQQCQK